RTPMSLEILTHRASPWKKWIVISAQLLLLASIPKLARGQAAESASIQGRVTDNSGAPLPGATITVTGPALQVPQVTTISDSDGNYKILDLPAPGVYKGSFTHAQFQAVVREDIHLSVGFAARVDAALPLGSVT